MSSPDLKRKIIAILLGAAVSILTELLKFYMVGWPPDSSGVVGGAVTAVAYLKMTAKAII